MRWKSKKFSKSGLFYYGVGILHPIQMIYFYSGSGIGAVVAYRRDEQSRGLILPFLYPMVGFIYFGSL